MAVALLAACSLVFGCGDEDQKRADAKKLFELLSDLQDERSLATRESALSGLEGLTLNEATQRDARDACVRAHRELLRAEAEQASARKALDQALQAAAPGTPQDMPQDSARDTTQDAPKATLSPEQAAAVAKALEQSNAALERAQKHFPPCEAAMQALVTQAR